MEEYTNTETDIEKMEFAKSLDWTIMCHKIFGILIIVQGVMVSLSILGLIGGVPMILAGLKLMESGKKLNDYKVMQDRNSLKSFFVEYRKYWIIMLITLAASVVLSMVSFFIFAGLIAGIIESLQSAGY